MKKMVKIVLITVLVALPALGTYVKTTLPNVGSAPGPAMERTAEGIEPGKCQESRIAGPINCKNNGNWSEFADPITEGRPDLARETENDFPVNFLFNVIPFGAELPGQIDVTIKRNNRSHLIAAVL